VGSRVKIAIDDGMDRSEIETDETHSQRVLENVMIEADEEFG